MLFLKSFERSVFPKGVPVAVILRIAEAGVTFTNASITVETGLILKPNDYQQINA